MITVKRSNQCYCGNLNINYNLPNTAVYVYEMLTEDSSDPTSIFLLFTKIWTDAELTKGEKQESIVQLKLFCFFPCFYAGLQEG